MQQNELSNSTPEMMEKLSFSCLPLRKELLTNLALLQFEVMTPIQQQTLPLMLNRRDVIAQANTGSGKTAAFGLAILNRIDLTLLSVQALVLCPTRELAEQVSQALRTLARLLPNVKIHNASGGIPMRSQLDSLKHGAHIIVGTPGRIQKHLDKASILLDALRVLVLDEADRMLDMGFVDDIKRIASICPINRQTLLFSATYPSEVKRLAQQFMRDPKTIHIESNEADYDIEQLFYEIPGQTDKASLLMSLLRHHQSPSTLIFCNTKQQTATLCTSLQSEGFSVTTLHGDLEQAERDLAMVRFANQSVAILVATDVAARGLDIKDLPLVINFDLAFEYDTHIHRIGRTGRAGSKGLALSLTTPADAHRLCVMTDASKHPITWGSHSELMHSKKDILLPLMVTFCLSIGKKDKIRPGDVLGALIKDAGLLFEMIGKINITAVNVYVAIHKSQADKAYQYFKHGKLKGRTFHVRHC